jgi:hypothetical protein
MHVPRSSVPALLLNARATLDQGTLIDAAPDPEQWVMMKDCRIAPSFLAEQGEFA